MGLYAEFDDVAQRYEGVMPDDREAWVELRIEDAESELIGLVPSLSADFRDEVALDRANRVRRLICDKVLALYRNPDGALSFSSVLGPRTESRTLSRSGQDSWVNFTSAELVRVGYRNVNSVGSAKFQAWSQTCRNDLYDPTDGCGV